MSIEATPAVKLRSQVVSRVVLAIILLAFGLYGSCVVLVLYGREVPGELWLAAGNASGALFALLINSKNEGPPPGGPDGPPVQVEGVPGGEPVITDPQGPLDVIPVKPELDPVP